MSLITRGFGITDASIITQGYGIDIQEIVIDAIEAVTRSNVIRISGGSSASGISSPTVSRTKNYINNEQGYEEYVISAALSSSGNKQWANPIAHRIRKTIKSFDINIDVQNVQVTINKKEIEVKIVLNSSSQKVNNLIEITTKIE